MKAAEGLASPAPGGGVRKGAVHRALDHLHLLGTGPEAGIAAQQIPNLVVTVASNRPVVGTLRVDRPESARQTRFVCGLGELPHDDEIASGVLPGKLNRRVGPADEVESTLDRQAAQGEDHQSSGRRVACSESMPAATFRPLGEAVGPEQLDSPLGGRGTPIQDERELRQTKATGALVQSHHCLQGQPGSDDPAHGIILRDQRNLNPLIPGRTIAEIIRLSGEMCASTQSPPRPGNIEPPIEVEALDREPAPGVLRLVQEFLNTHDIEAGVDQLGSPQAAVRWLYRHNLIETQESIGRAEWNRALEVREALRLLLIANDGRGPVDFGELERLNQVAARSRFVLRFAGDGQAQLEPTAKGVDAAVGWVLAAVLTAMSEGTWSRLKICHRESCRWAFYDHSRNQSGKWCSMAICGNRSKVEAYRRRRSSPSRRSGEGETRS